MKSCDLKALGELISIIGGKDLDISLTNHVASKEYIDKVMNKLPTPFKARLLSHGSTSWKDAEERNVYGFNSLEITMFYPSNSKHATKKGGDENC